MNVIGHMTMIIGAALLVVGIVRIVIETWGN